MKRTITVCDNCSKEMSEPEYHDNVLDLHYSCVRSFVLINPIINFVERFKDKQYRSNLVRLKYPRKCGISESIVNFMANNTKYNAKCFVRDGASITHKNHLLLKSIIDSDFANVDVVFFDNVKDNFYKLAIISEPKHSHIMFIDIESVEPTNQNLNI